MFRKRASADDLVIFFATDIHGSNVCWKKFVNAGKFYGANVLVLGGDVTGKMVVPTEQDDHSTRAGASRLGREALRGRGK